MVGAQDTAPEPVQLKEVGKIGCIVSKTRGTPRIVVRFVIWMVAIMVDVASVHHVELAVVAMVS